MVRINNTPIIVDEFKFVPGVYIYLLTHLHSDHTGGLTPSWNNGTIYCSPITAAMLLEKFNVNPDLVVVLEEDKTHNIPLDMNSHKVTMQATLIDSNHCPGACMFLLEGYFGTILHTGDFRFDPLILQHEVLRNKKIDYLYLDDTFLDPAYDFPSRAEAGKEILEIISHYPENYQIVIGMDTLGKEELLVAIALTFKTLIVVSEERLQMLNTVRKVVHLPDVFTHDPALGRVVVLAKNQVNYKKIMQYKQARPTVGIQPSGWSVAMLDKNKNKNVFQRKVIHRVAYSLHSSYSELEHFVKVLKPKMLYSVSKHDNVALRDYFGKYCSTEHPPAFEIPRTVLLSMETKKRSLAVSGGNRQPSVGGSTRRRSQRIAPPTSAHKRTKGARIMAQPTLTQGAPIVIDDGIVDLTEDSPTQNTFIEDDNEMEEILVNLFGDDEEEVIIKRTSSQEALEILEHLGDEMDASPDEELDDHQPQPIENHMPQMPAMTQQEALDNMFCYPHVKRDKVMRDINQAIPALSQSSQIPLSLENENYLTQLLLSDLVEDKVMTPKKELRRKSVKSPEVRTSPSPTLKRKESPNSTPASDEKRRKSNSGSAIGLVNANTEKTEDDDDTKRVLDFSPAKNTANENMSTQALLDMPLTLEGGFAQNFDTETQSTVDLHPSQSRNSPRDTQQLQVRNSPKVESQPKEMKLPPSRENTPVKNSPVDHHFHTTQSLMDMPLSLGMDDSNDDDKDEDIVFNYSNQEEKQQSQHVTQASTQQELAPTLSASPPQQVHTTQSLMDMPFSIQNDSNATQNIWGQTLPGTQSEEELYEEKQSQARDSPKLESQKSQPKSESPPTNNYQTTQSLMNMPLSMNAPDSDTQQVQPSQLRSKSSLKQSIPKELSMFEDWKQEEVTKSPQKKTDFPFAKRRNTQSLSNSMRNSQREEPKRKSLPTPTVIALDDDDHLSCNMFVDEDDSSADLFQMFASENERKAASNSVVEID